MANHQALRALSSVIQTAAGNTDHMLLSSPAEALNLLTQFGKDRAENHWVSNGPQWTGLGSQSFSDFCTQGYSTEALRSFNLASAKLRAEHRIGGGIRPAVAGGAWVMPLVINSNPMPARQKIRAKLAPINLKLEITFHGGTDAQNIAKIGAALSRALWDYQMAGGAVSLTLAVWCGYDQRSEHKSRSAFVECRIPLVSESAIATVFSPVFYRACLFPLCDVLSTSGHDAMRVEGTPPGYTSIRGNFEQDKRAIQALGVEL